jgi:L-ascorbate metabolism protein UlaG (beta-lactamase superfamily)
MTRIRWFGQSAFQITADRSVLVDPFGEMGEGLAARGLEFRYPPIEAVSADLLLVTHEHRDHNAVSVVGGSPVVLRSTAGRLESPIGEVVAIASEHDPEAGTSRGPNTIFVFGLDGLRLAHFGDFGQSALRPEQRAAIGEVDLVFLPVGGGPTIGAKAAAAIVADLDPRWAVPMHYRTARTSFLETEEQFVAAIERVERLPEPIFETAELPAEGPCAVVPAAP